MPVETPTVSNPLQTKHPQTILLSTHRQQEGTVRTEPSGEYGSLDGGRGGEEGKWFKVKNQNLHPQTVVLGSTIHGEMDELTSLRSFAHRKAGLLSCMSHAFRVLSEETVTNSPGM